LKQKLTSEESTTRQPTYVPYKFNESASEKGNIGYEEAINDERCQQNGTKRSRRQHLDEAIEDGQPLYATVPRRLGRLLWEMFSPQVGSGESDDE